MLAGMAELAEAHARLVPLAELGGGWLDAVLAEAVTVWDRRLHWDFRGTAELIRSYAEARALEGLALVVGGEAAGYCYWVHEGPKALLGDLFVQQRWRTAAAEGLLLEGTLRELARQRASHGIRRVEAQLMQMGTRANALLTEGARPQAFGRLFMLRGLAKPPERVRTALPGIGFEPWQMRWKAAAADLITVAYEKHVDSRINDQYLTAQGAGRFLQNIVQYPGCGTLLPAVSQVALDQAGAMAGLALATRVAPQTGHIAQICVRREWAGTGLAYEMLRRALAAMHEVGIREASLTVTEANERAVGLYERCGFHAIHRFEALVWA